MAPKNRVFRGAGPEYQNTIPGYHISQNGILDFSPKNAVAGLDLLLRNREGWRADDRPEGVGWRL
jgi:hypothetical protein